MRYSKKLLNQAGNDNAWLKRKEKVVAKKKSKSLNRKLKEKLDAGQMVSSIIREVTMKAEDRTLKDKFVREDYLRINKLRKQSNPRLFDLELARGMNHISEEISIDNSDGIIEKNGKRFYKGSGSNAFALLKLDMRLSLNISKGGLNGDIIKKDKYTMCKIGGKHE